MRDEDGSREKQEKKVENFFPLPSKEGRLLYSLRDFARRINSNPSFAVSADEGEYEYARGRGERLRSRSSCEGSFSRTSKRVKRLIMNFTGQSVIISTIGRIWTVPDS